MKEIKIKKVKMGKNEDLGEQIYSLSKRYHRITNYCLILNPSDKSKLRDTITDYTRISYNKEVKPGEIIIAKR